MTKILDVYFHQAMIGQLMQDDYGDMNFTYATSWLESSAAVKISCSLPLQHDTFTKEKCQAFFGGILPEENQRKLIAKNLRITANNDFSMLEKIGGECAGALTFLPAGQTPSSSSHLYHELTLTELPAILRELPEKPLLAGEKNIRLSLAGVQDKLAVYIKEKKIFLPLDNSPSTHILKPDFTSYKGVIFNEAFCLALAKHIGLSVANAELKKIEDINYLLVERYDRILTPDTYELKRLHQEDFCQALGISAKNKYQSEGGPTLKQCFDLLRTESSAPVIDLGKLLNAVIFNFLIGNCDAHGKNFSLLYLDQLQMAPLYDLICTLYYENLNQKMAMKLGGEYEITRITIQNFDKLAKEINFAKPEMHRRILELINKTLAALLVIEPQYPIQEKVSALIKNRCEEFAKHLSKHS